MQKRKLSKMGCSWIQTVVFINSIVFGFFVMLQMTGCVNQTSVKEEGAPVTKPQPAIDTTRPPYTPDLDEFQRLLNQKYIDPLTDYIANNRNDQTKLKYVKRLEKEKQKRCEEIRQLFRAKDKENRMLVRLERGYGHSCPKVVKEFAEQVTAVAKKSIDGIGDCQVLYKIGNYKEAILACHPYAEKGNAFAQYNLGTMHSVLQDYKKANMWIRKSALQGYAKAEHSLGQFYYNGSGVQQDYKEAMEWFRLAATHGSVEAQMVLAQMYGNGEGAPSDYQEGLKWLRLAADQRNNEAQYRLGQLYFYGLGGVHQDYNKAFKWFRFAAEQDSTKAQIKLGEMYSRGEGVTSNQTQAFVWFSLAAMKSDNTASIERDNLAKNLNSEQLRNANVQIQEMSIKQNRK